MPVYGLALSRFLPFSLFSRLGGGRWEKRVGVMRGPASPAPETSASPSPVVRTMKTIWLGFLFLLAVASSAAAQPPAPVRSELGVMIPMRDGVKLAADVWLPEAPGRYPVLLVRTPYMKPGFKLYEWPAYCASLA